MSISKEIRRLDMLREEEFGYSQAIKVGDTIYLSGQIAYDDVGNFVGRGDMEAQMYRAYENVQKLLARFDATMANVVDEVLFVTDMEAAIAARDKLRGTIFHGQPVLASTIVQIERLAVPETMVEIKCIARV